MRQGCKQLPELLTPNAPMFHSKGPIFAGRDRGAAGERTYFRPSAPKKTRPSFKELSIFSGLKELDYCCFELPRKRRIEPLTFQICEDHSNCLGTVNCD